MKDRLNLSKFKKRNALKLFENYLRFGEYVSSDGEYSKFVTNGHFLAAIDNQTYLKLSDMLDGLGLNTREYLTSKSTDYSAVSMLIDKVRGYSARATRLYEGKNYIVLGMDSPEAWNFGEIVIKKMYWDVFNKDGCVFYFDSTAVTVSDEYKNYWGTIMAFRPESLDVCDDAAWVNGEECLLKE